MLNSIDDVLKDREVTHGSFNSVASCAQCLKNDLRDSPRYDLLSLVQREAVEMICTKLSRIVNGNCNEDDHWKDIIGYCELVRKANKP